MIKNRKSKILITTLIGLLVCATMAWAAWREYASITTLDTRSIGSLSPYRGIELKDQFRHKVVALSWTTGVGFVIPPANSDSTYQGAIYEIDSALAPSSSANLGDTVAYMPNGVACVTAYVTDPTLLTDGLVSKIRASGSGTTKIVFLTAGGLPINSTSGVTFDPLLDSIGDYVEIENNMNGGVSVYVNAQRNT